MVSKSMKVKSKILLNIWNEIKMLQCRLKPCVVKWHNDIPMPHTAEPVRKFCTGSTTEAGVGLNARFQGHTQSQSYEGL